jgi:surface protein
MEFFIKKNATLPLLKLQVVKNGRLDYNNFMSLIEQSALFFSMVDVESGVPKITSRPAGFVEKTNVDPNADPEYYLYYQFQNRDTNRVGRYEGQFMLRSSDGVLILPIREKLFINVQESYIADDLEYDSCYVSEFPCCVNGPTTAITINLNLVSVVTPSSVKVDYVLTSSEVLSDNLTLSFTNTLGQLVGTGLTISTGITINAGSNIGFSEVILPNDYYNLDGTSTFSNVSVNYPIAYNFVEGFNTIFPPAPTPTPSPVQQILDAIITEETDVYVDVGNDEYLSFVDPTLEYLVNVFIASGSVVTTFTITSNVPINEVVSIPLSLNLGLIGGGSATISASVVIPANQTLGQTITNNSTLDFYSLNQTAELFIDSPSVDFPINFLANQIQFEQPPTPTPTPTNTPTNTPTPTPTLTPTQSPIPPAELELFIQTLSGGQSIIFDGTTYSTDTLLTINKNQSYNIEAVPQPGYLFAGWNIFGGSFSSTGQSTTVTVFLDSGANLAPSYNPDPNFDALEAQLTTSLVSYQNTTSNNWVKITQTEYNNIFNNVDGVVKIGNDDTQINTRATATGYDITTFGTTDVDTPLTIGTGYYVVGFIAESWNQVGTIEFGYTTTFHTGTPTYMGNAPSIDAGTRSYYVRKKPFGVEGAPATVDLYPVLNFGSPAYPNAVPNTFGWYTLDGGTTWLQTDPNSQTAKIQILITDVRSWPTPNPFISVWRTTSPSESITLPLESSGTYDFIVDWGDGSPIDTITSWNQVERTHTYSVAADYVVKIEGTITGFNMGQIFGLNVKLIEIKRWGCLRLVNGQNYFYNCPNLSLTGVTDTLKLDGISNLTNMFAYCSNITTINNLDLWDVSNVTNMSNMFFAATYFNHNISSWNVSGVTDMSSMFSYTNFNQNIGNWNVSNVISMNEMFKVATSFNQDLSTWCVTNIPSTPTDFDNNATSWVLSRPVWGTCPP